MADSGIPSVGRAAAADATYLLSLLAPQELQVLQDSLASITGLHFSCITVAGRPLARSGLLSEACRRLRQSACRLPEHQCAFAAGELRQTLAAAREPVLARCPYLGLHIAAVPLYVRNAWLATVVCGRVAASDLPDEAELRRLGLSLRAGELELRAALAEAPALDAEAFAARVAHVHVAVQGLGRLIQARAGERRAQHALEATNRRLGALGAIGSSIMRSHSLEGSLAEALRTIVDVLQLDGGAIFLRSEEDGSLLLAAHQGVTPEFTAAGDLITGLLHGALEPWVVPDVSREPELPPGAPAQWRFGAFVAAPLRAAAEMMGALTVHTAAPRPFRPDEVALIGAAAEQVGIGVRGLRLLAAEKQRAGEVLALQQFNERILHTMQEGIFIVDAASRITYATPRLAEISGYTVEELVGRTWSLFAGSEGRRDLRRFLSTFRDGHRARYEAEFHRRDGQARHIAVGIVPLFEAGEFAGVLGVVADLTDEVELRRRLQQAEKLSAIGELVSGVAHELNNPLTVIRGYAQILGARDDMNPANHELRAITEQAERAARIVQGLLTFAREREPAQEPVRLNAILESVLDQRRDSLAASGIRVERDLAEGLPDLFGDSFQLQQVFLNILINAEQALAEQGGGGKIRVRTMRAEDEVLAEVRDNGPGVPTGLLSRIFDPFFTTRADRLGTGLGLSICYGIVNAHGGRIWAESEDGEGAAFFVALPAARLEAAAPSPAGQDEPEAATGGRRVLVLEDEVEIAELVSRCLREMGCRVSVAHEGQLALDLTERESFDLILTDLKMPGMNGREFYARLADARPELAGRVIFVTGDMVSPETERFLTESGRPHLAKPFSLEELEEAVLAAL